MLTIANIAGLPNSHLEKPLPNPDSELRHLGDKVSDSAGSGSQVSHVLVLFQEPFDNWQLALGSLKGMPRVSYFSLSLRSIDSVLEKNLPSSEGSRTLEQAAQESYGTPFIRDLQESLI